MSWVPERLINLSKGQIFRRKGHIFVHCGDAGKRGRAVWASLIVPVADQPYCLDADDHDCEHYQVDGVEYHNALFWPGEEDNDDCDFEPGLFIRKRSLEIMMRVELYNPESA